MPRTLTACAVLVRDRRSRSADAALGIEGMIVVVPGWSIRDDVAWTDDSERVVALSLARWRDCRPVAIEGTGAVVWRAIAGRPGIELEVLAREMAAAHDHDIGEVRSDLSNLLQTLRREVLVQAE
ncbi:PqqD family peptide modification chaperone [Microbacterium allomyrinae]|uniref:PqqD family peptide modification chaperone n=1 Tax=Microbacterium allomyrinae TaxID=2830666 RepID=A0A9X1LXV5_9MICO|nr:PqqD family peptide modification chaperone [Microbacterium allomyrinae]MCC2034042.1 PqqD family peptide modification chaperone [Microbacterium allomyrinae]